MTKKIAIILMLAPGCGTNAIADGGTDAFVPSDSGPIIDAAGDVITDTGVPIGDGGPDASPDSGSFDVTKVPGLVLWLEASQKVTQNNGFVSSWGDLSGNGNNATQATQALQPFLQQATINGRPAVHFTDANMGTVLTIADAATLNWGTKDYAIWIVGQYTNTPVYNGSNADQGCFFNKYDTLSAGVYGPFLFGNPTVNGYVVIGFGTGAGTSYAAFQTKYNDGAPRLYAAHRTPMELDLRVNGNIVAADSKVATDLASPGIPIRIGMELDGNRRRLKGDIAEIIAIRGTFTLQDVQQVDTYLKAKYAL